MELHVCTLIFVKLDAISRRSARIESPRARSGTEEEASRSEGSMLDPSRIRYTKDQADGKVEEWMWR